MAPEEGHQGIVFPEIFGEELANISAIEIGEPIEIQTGDRTVAKFPLDDGGARQVHMVRHVFLGHVTRFPRRPKSPSEFVLTA